ncbi:splicing factor 3B subunit 1-like isoform X2 [Daphnia magna]|uniref:splicing factor 3B subunit 1-like n=1 Tax=Daphnia magna TaxID=35525 RepID=UPI001E1BD720|nr:splicing factor 3B subunit 1-like [Daphnia magna]XP_045023280.1 splicing factor 3B subunit 1-like [Daphnia magna]XP_045035756.1 splicing factor 3B subunit 1-like isoform X2 [Daphnia magna]
MSFQVSSMLYRNCSSSSGNPVKEQEIYGEVQSRFDGYVTSIATTDEVEGEDYDGAVAIGGRQTFTAPAAILNNVAGEDFDPFAEHRRSTIADREDEYRAMRWKLIISPERVDSFAEGGLFTCGPGADLLKFPSREETVEELFLLSVAHREFWTLDLSLTLTLFVKNSCAPKSKRSAVSLPTKDGTLKAVSVPSNGESRRPPIFRQAID